MNIETGTLSQLNQKDAKKHSSSRSPEVSFKEEFAALDAEKISTEEDLLLQGNNGAENAVDVNGDKLLQMNDFPSQNLASMPNLPDTNNRGHDIEKESLQAVLNNDMNIHKLKEQSSELKADISFAQNGGEAFSSFLNSGSFSESQEEMSEDMSVLSTAAQNLAMINKSMAELNASKIKEVGVIIDRVIDASSLNLTRNDLTLFVNLINNEINFFEVTSKEDVKTSNVSEILANMMAESMRSNKAFRLNFDNGISVIIKVSTEGKISANFLPGTDAAENYLKNNISNLVQRFEEEGIPYDELSHHKQKRNNEQQNKKDKDNE